MTDPILVIDGKPVRRFVFVRYSHLEKRSIPVEVWGFSKDHALARLKARYIGIKGWEFVQELEDPAHTIGRMGDILKIDPTTIKYEVN